jgi:Ras-related protein Rab-2A
MKLQIWDTAGQEHFRAVTRSYFRNAAGCLLVYDVSRRQTFENVQNWLNDIREQADENIVICLVGNKLDLVDNRQVTSEEASQWAKENGIVRFVETSAKTGKNVVKAYEEVAQLIHENIVQGKYDLNDRSHGVKANKSSLINLSVEASSKKKRNCC